MKDDDLAFKIGKHDNELKVILVLIYDGTRACRERVHFIPAKWQESFLKGMASGYMTSHFIR